MRELKFRAWDKKWERWFDPEDVEVDGDGTVWGTRRAEDEKIEVCDGRAMIVEQYTGLRDKHGREIYEGDILLNNFDRDKRHPVEWRDGVFHLGDGFSPLVRYRPNEFWEVCGNIHENPDLLKESKE